jgi:hypothetical protein
MINPRNTPPPRSQSKGVTDINTGSHRERDENYADIVVKLAPRHRIILCPQGLQWIFQEQEASHEAPWRAQEYHTSRESLLNACGKRGFLSDPNVEAGLHELPNHVSHLARK